MTRRCNTFGGWRTSVPTLFARMALEMEDFAEITALVADRATLFRHGLIRLLQERRAGWSCAEAGTVEEVQAHLSVEPVDLVLLDLQLAGGRALTGLRRLRELFPEQRIAILSDSEEREAILDCLGAGANGYILKSATLGAAFAGGRDHPVGRRVRAGGAGRPGAVRRSGRVRRTRAHLAVQLTERQIEVFHLLSQGCATKTIARRLGLAVGTVKVHLAGIYRVLGAHNRVEAIAKAGAGHVQAVQVPDGVALVGGFSG